MFPLVMAAMFVPLGIVLLAVRGQARMRAVLYLALALAVAACLYTGWLLGNDRATVKQAPVVLIPLSCALVPAVAARTRTVWMLIPAGALALSAFAVLGGATIGFFFFPAAFAMWAALLAGLSELLRERPAPTR